ncbi:uncharacterized protein [Parasteatoda tepidariorum]|uniref:uncharacterized protein n=1 Tax=Parasteatoda tepidariorum TaxID=114398 RepID=UPI0039BC8A30
MSYNEKIAKFLSLMGSFYEIVSPEDCEAESDQKAMYSQWSEDIIPSAVIENYESRTISDMYNITRRERQLDFSTEKEIEGIGHLANKSSLNPQSVRSNAHQVTRENFQRSYSQSSLSSSTNSSSDVSNFDLLSDLSDVESQVVTERDNVHLLQSRQNSQVSHCPTHSDIFILTFINLQSSMNDILEKMESLNTLANEENQDKCQYNSNFENESDFSLNWTGTVFALLWPVVVEVILG